MTKPSQKRGFASRPADPESWIRTPAEPAAVQVKGDAFTARLTIDVTPELRGRIKITAFGRGVTVADMLRDLPAGEFPDTSGDPSCTLARPSRRAPVRSEDRRLGEECVRTGI